MRLTCPGALYIFKEGSFLRKLKSLGTGLLLGFVCIIILNLAEWISGTTVFSYNGFDWHLIPLIPLVFILCSAEEMLLRGYVPAVLGEKHSWDVVCFVSGMLFIFHHVLNMEIYGFELVYCLNIFSDRCVLLPADEMGRKLLGHMRRAYRLELYPVVHNGGFCS